MFQFDYPGDPANVIIDLTDAHIWDASTVASLDAITTKYAARGTTVTITGMNRTANNATPRWPATSAARTDKAPGQQVPTIHRRRRQSAYDNATVCESRY